MRCRHLLALPIFGLLTAMLVALGPSATASIVDRDCSDFATQKAAQIFFLSNGGPASDPHRLDYDGDGIACESNPCTCYYKKTLPDGSTSTAPTQVRQKARVIRVVDGDTVDVRLATGAERRVRLIGIDTPEVYGGVECGGPEASSSLKKILPQGTVVLLVSDPSQALKDRYGRLLRYVTKSSTGKDVNRMQIARGWATVYVYNNNPFARVGTYRTAQQSANSADRGIWGLC